MKHALLIAVFGAVVVLAAPAFAQTPKAATTKSPLTTSVLIPPGMGREWAALPVAERYRMLKATLPPETRRVVIALMPDLRRRLSPAKYSFSLSSQIESAIHGILRPTFRTTTPLALDVLTLYVLLELGLPESDASVAVSRGVDLGKGKDRAGLRQFSEAASVQYNLQFSASQLVYELMACTSDADPKVVQNLRP